MNGRDADRIVPKALATALLNIAPSATLLSDAQQITPERGAYLVLIQLAKPVEPMLTRFKALRFNPGWYVYCGSAYGPGGLRARLKRHLQPHKTKRWHVDHLTCAAAQIQAVALIGGSECELFAALAAQPCFDVPAPGFGSSDCRICASHLLMWNG